MSTGEGLAVQQADLSQGQLGHIAGAGEIVVDASGNWGWVPPTLAVAGVLTLAACSSGTGEVPTANQANPAPAGTEAPATVGPTTQYRKPGITIAVSCTSPDHPGFVNDGQTVKFGVLGFNTNYAPDVKPTAEDLGKLGVSTYVSFLGPKGELVGFASEPGPDGVSTVVPPTAVTAEVGLLNYTHEQPDAQPTPDQVKAAYQDHLRIVKETGAPSGAGIIVPCGQPLGRGDFSILA